MQIIKARHFQPASNDEDYVIQIRRIYALFIQYDDKSHLQSRVKMISEL